MCNIGATMTCPIVIPKQVQNDSLREPKVRVGIFIFVCEPKDFDGLSDYAGRMITNIGKPFLFFIQAGYTASSCKTMSCNLLTASLLPSFCSTCKKGGSF